VFASCRLVRRSKEQIVYEWRLNHETDEIRQILCPKFFAARKASAKKLILLASFTKRAQPVVAREFDLTWANPDFKKT
jgi:hypothetical protein